MARWKRDVILGIGFELFFAAAYTVSLNVPVGTMGSMKAAQPGVYLRIWLVIFALLTLAMIINALRKKDETPVPRIFHPQAVITLAVVGGYIWLLDILGFTAATLLFTSILILDYSWAAGKFLDGDGKRKLGKALAKSVCLYLLTAAAATGATQYIFESLLMVNLP